MKNFNELLTGLIEELIVSGIDDDSHFRYHYYDNSCDSKTSNQIEKFICDIDKVDCLMSSLRPIILKTLRKIAEDYKSEDYRE